MNRNQFISEYGELSNEILLNIAEILTLRLPEGNERIIASKWVKKFINCDPKVYQHHLTLFVSCLTKQLLVDPFDKPPKDTSSSWYNFDKEYTQKKINDLIIHRLYKDSFTPPYHIDMSNDMKEYVAFQEIPYFGAHFYYAFSPRDKIDKWSKFNKMNVPRNLIEILRKDDPVESPIKGRLFPRSKSKTSETVNVNAQRKIQKIPKPKKPEWEDLIERDEPETEPEKKPTIVIPTDVPIKNIPVALQRRMAKAEQEKHERLAKKAKETKNLQSKLEKQNQSASSRRSIHIKSSARKKIDKHSKSIKGIVVDDIDASLITKKPSEAPLKPKSPEFKGPHADLQRRLFHLRKSNLPTELIKTTHEISQVSGDINREAERLQRDGTANLQNVEKLHNTSLNVGQRILNMLKEHQADEIKDLAENAAGALENVQLTMDQLNEMLGEGKQSHDETLKKLNEIKERMQRSAQEAQNVSIRMNGTRITNELLNVMDDMINVNENSAYLLQNIPVESQQEGILIDGLERSNQELADIIQVQRNRLSRALDRLEPNLLPILEETVKNIDEILSVSFHENSQLVENVIETSNVQKAIEIDSQKNEHLIDMKTKTLQILNDIEFAAAKFMNADVSDDLIDIDNEDLGFSDVFDEYEMEKQRQLKMMERQEKFREQKTQLVHVDGSENLADISAELIDDLEKSISEIDQFLIPGLQKIEINGESAREIVHGTIQILEESVEGLQNLLIDVTNLKEAVKSDNEPPIEYDLITFEEEDLIKFD